MGFFFRLKEFYDRVEDTDQVYVLRLQDDYFTGKIYEEFPLLTKDRTHAWKYTLSEAMSVRQLDSRFISFEVTPIVRS